MRLPGFDDSRLLVPSRPRTRCSRNKRRGARSTHLRNTLGDPSGGRVTGWSTSQGRGGSWFPRPTSSRAARIMSDKYCVSIALRLVFVAPAPWTNLPAGQRATRQLIGLAQVRSSPQHRAHSAVARHGAPSDPIPAVPRSAPGAAASFPPVSSCLAAGSEPTPCQPNAPDGQRSPPD